MNSKSFRRNHGAKPRSTSSTFISLHFNKADEDQLEISYKDDDKIKDEGDATIKSASEVTHSNLTLYVPNAKTDIGSSSETIDEEHSAKDDENISNDSLVKAYWARINKKTNFSCNEELAEESFKTKFPKTFEGLKNNECVKSEVLDDSVQDVKCECNEVDAGDSSTTSNDSQLKLSPAIEAAELDNDDSFNNYINDELEKAKCEILDTKNEMSSSFTSLSNSKKNLQKESYSSPDLQVYSETECSEELPSENNQHDINEATKTSHFYNILHKSINFLNFAKNSVKFHILIAIFAFLCAPIPSWLSGFLIGTVLSSSLVYWLYKPVKNKKSFHNFYFVPSQTIRAEKLGEDSGILKGWMNELPSFMTYNSDRYHVSCTRSVYVRLDGSYLRFSFPQKNISKRAMFNEPRHELQFVYQQHYDIAEAVIELLPKGLTNKRLWSKKYPICLRIPNSKEAVLSNSSRADTLDTSFSAKTNRKEISNKKFSPRVNENNEIVIYLFSRTDRDKNLWYYRFQKASKMKVARSHSPTLSTRITESDSTLENKRTKSVDFAFLQSSSSMQMEQPFFGEEEMDDPFVEVSLSKHQKFEIYLSSLLAPLHEDHPFVQLKKDKKDTGDKKLIKTVSNQSNLTWLNVLIGRLGFDFLVEDVWAQLVTEKIQKKLNRIKLPFFLTELTVKDVNLGSALPKIHHASDPSIDERGLWVDIDVSYNGSFHMTLETKLSLRKFKADSEEFWSSLSEVSKENENSEQVKLSSYNSEEDSMESSSDDEAFSPEINEDGSLNSLPSSTGSRSNKFLKFVYKLAQSPHFQHAAKNKYIKRAMEDISNTPLVLTVEVQWLTGTLALNIPPWPTDRLWYGFRVNPSLSITARPKLGQHVVTFTQVTEWIEKKLVSEFQKILVMPNMDDLIIPIMQPCSDILEV